jgi:hypothetical protein
MRQPFQLLDSVKRGLAGYVTYLAACSMHEAYSEYLLYEPVLRILTAKSCMAKCEFACNGLGGNGRGDKRRIDFKVSRDGSDFAMEVKWIRKIVPKFDRDLEKLLWFKKEYKGSMAFLCVFGTKSMIERMKAPQGTKEVGKAVFSDVGRTRYGCRIFQV